MKTLPCADITPADLQFALTVRRDGESCHIFYAGDDASLDSPEAIAASAQKRYEAALTAHFHHVAAERRYDSYITVTMRAGFPGPFQAEAIAFGQWMDGCNVAGYVLIERVKAGLVGLPTVEDFIASLPPMTWPE